MDRPGFRSAVGDLMTGRAHALLAEDLDRLARDPRDLEDLIDCAERKGAVIRSLSAGEIHLDTGDGRAMARVVCAFSRKESEDKARRVADSRERLAGKSYGGGKRPYGYQPDPDAPQYRKTLIVVEAEAAVLRDAAAAILDRDISLKAIARDLRDRNVPTVTGTAWTASTLRDCLSKPAVAGIAVHTKTERDAETGEEHAIVTEHPGAWPAILERDTWERLCDLFTSRKTGTSPEPRWLVSCYAICGVCGGLTKCTGGSTRRAYTCIEHGHVRRNAAAVDEYIAGVAVARLSQPDMAGLLRPPPRPGTDTAELRAEARKLADRKRAQMRMHAAGDIDDTNLATGLRAIRDRMAVVESQLAASDAPDPLAEFRDRRAAAVWEALTLPRKRAIVQLLMTVTILPVVKRGNQFDEDSVRIEWTRAAC